VEGEGREGVGGEAGRGGRGEVKKPVVEDICHGQEVSHGTTGASGEGRDSGVLMAMLPFHHVLDACVQIVEEVLNPHTLGIVDGEAEGSIKGVAVIPVGEVGQASSSGASLVPPGEPFGGARALALEEMV